MSSSWGYDESRALFDTLRDAVDVIGTAELQVTKSQIAFRRRKAFAWAWIPGKYLRGKTAPLVLTLSFRSRDPHRAGKRLSSRRLDGSRITWSCTPPTISTGKCMTGCGTLGKPLVSHSIGWQPQGGTREQLPAHNLAATTPGSDAYLDRRSWAILLLVRHCRPVRRFSLRAHGNQHPASAAVRRNDLQPLLDGRPGRGRSGDGPVRNGELAPRAESVSGVESRARRQPGGRCGPGAPFPSASASRRSR